MSYIDKGIDFTVNYNYWKRDIVKYFFKSFSKYLLSTSLGPRDIGVNMTGKLLSS